MTKKPSSLRDLPGVDAVLRTQAMGRAAGVYGQTPATTAVRTAIAALRTEVVEGTRQAPLPSAEELGEQVAAELKRAESTRLRPVVNATGVLLHTNLGRAPLAEAACQAMHDVAAGYANVELDLTTGKRTRRSLTVAAPLCRLTGAEAALIVNNNAGALGLTLGALAAGREIIVSHGELIEIGGGYRLPEVIEMFGARLRAVGSTNKTRADDYAKAISTDTAVLLAVHPSNYRISGFTAAPRIAELAEVAREHQVPLVHDIGSGAMFDLSEWGFAGEPVAAESIAAGADVVLFSGDKLLGGPQCGVIVGRRDLVERCEQHPLNRALRVDKMTLAGLAATLALYERTDPRENPVPVLKMLTCPLPELEARTRRFAKQLREKTSHFEITVQEDQAYLGGGTTPDQALPSWSIGLTLRGVTSERLAEALRLGEPAVVARVQNDTLIVSLHAVPPKYDAALMAAACGLAAVDSQKGTG